MIRQVPTRVEASLAPPARKKQSASSMRCAPLPPCTLSKKSLSDASNSNPATVTSFPEVIIQPCPFAGTSVASPVPSTTVSSFLTESGSSSVYMPGVKNRCLPSSSAALSVRALSPSLAT